MMPILMGVGLLINTVQALQGQGEMNQMKSEMESQNAAMMKSLKETGGFSFAKKGAEVKSTINWDFQAPAFPDKNYKNVQQMQMGHVQERQEATQRLQKEVADMKKEFFGSNHYQTKPGADGKPQVATNEQGQPLLGKGAENADQKLARLQFDNARKTELADRQADQREKFVTSERTSVKEFLAQNKEQLANPYVQGELQKMVVDTKKKALQIAQNHEDERWKVDLPPVAEMAAKVEGGLQQVREMDAQHLQAEENSPDMKALMEHDQQVAAILTEQKDLAQSSKPDEEFLKDPRKQMAAAATQTKVTRDVGEVLPGYLTTALYDLGVYQV